MQQFFLEKRGGKHHQSWTSRVLTLDRERQCIYMSKKGSKELVLNKRMSPIRVSCWPEYRDQVVYQLPGSKKAELSVRVEGWWAPATHDDWARLDYTGATVAEAEAPLSFADGRPTTLLDPHAVPRGKKTEWVLRCNSEEQLWLLMLHLQELMTPPSVEPHEELYGESDHLVCETKIAA